MDITKSIMNAVEQINKKKGRPSSELKKLITESKKALKGVKGPKKDFMNMVDLLNDRIHFVDKKLGRGLEMDEIKKYFKPELERLKKHKTGGCNICMEGGARMVGGKKNQLKSAKFPLTIYKGSEGKVAKNTTEYIKLMKEGYTRKTPLETKPVKERGMTLKAVKLPHMMYKGTDQKLATTMEEHMKLSSQGYKHKPETKGSGKVKSPIHVVVENPITKTAMSVSEIDPVQHIPHSVPNQPPKPIKTLKKVRLPPAPLQDGFVPQHEGYEGEKKTYRVKRGFIEVSVPDYMETRFL
jgi:hypothetical protein